MRKRNRRNEVGRGCIYAAPFFVHLREGDKNAIVKEENNVPKTMAEKLENLKKMRPIDDMFFEVLAHEPGVCEEILRVILKKKELKVAEVRTQESVRNLYGRGVRLDAKCDLGNGEIVLIEIQRADSDDHMRRVRYNAASVTVRDSEPGTSFRSIPTVYSVYITEFDAFGEGRTVYHIVNVIRESGTELDDGLHRIFVNTAVKDGSPIAALMGCFVQQEINDSRFPSLTRGVRRLKHTKGGRRVMCEIMDRLIQDEVKEERERFIRNFFRNGASLELIAKSLDLEIEDVKRVLANGELGD